VHKRVQLWQNRCRTCNERHGFCLVVSRMCPAVWRLDVRSGSGSGSVACRGRPPGSQNGCHVSTEVHARFLELYVPCFVLGEPGRALTPVNLPSSKTDYVSRLPCRLSVSFSFFQFLASFIYWNSSSTALNDECAGRSCVLAATKETYRIAQSV
jgi:hypothetical protein